MNGEVDVRKLLRESVRELQTTRAALDYALAKCGGDAIGREARAEVEGRIARLDALIGRIQAAVGN